MIDSIRKLPKSISEKTKQVLHFTAYKDVDKMSHNAISSDDVLKALTSEFNATYYVNLETSAVAFIELNDRIQSAMGSSYNDKLKIEDYARIYASKLVHPNYIEAFLAQVNTQNLKTIMANQKVYTYKYLGLNNGLPNYYMMKAARINNSPIHIVVGFADINEQVHNEEAQAAALDAANSVKTDFLMNISHELLTPLNAIKGFNEIAKTCLSSPDDLMYYLTQVDAATERMLKLIHNILSATELTYGHTEVTNSIFDIKGAVRSLENMLLPEARLKNINFVTDTSEIRSNYVLVDSSFTNRIFLQLLDNAFKYTPSGGTVILSISQTVINEKTIMNEIHIKDNGIGMSKAFSDNLFMPFSREKNSTENGIPGCGLGMHITKQLVEMLDGTISVISKENFGTDFKICIPTTVANAS